MFDIKKALGLKRAMMYEMKEFKTNLKFSCRFLFCTVVGDYINTMKTTLEFNLDIN